MTQRKDTRGLWLDRPEYILDLRSYLFQGERSFYFADETGDLYGPFPTFTEASLSLWQYCRWLNNNTEPFTPYPYKQYSQ